MSKRDRYKPEPIDTTPAPASEQLPCLVVRSTPDGYVVGKALVSEAGVTWLSPRHVRPFTETRPVDITLSAEKWANADGTVTLKPKRVAKGTPVPTVVGHHVVFGEQLDAAAQRARLELRRQFDAMVRGRVSHWRHLCQRAPSQSADLPLWLGTPRGEACPHCGATEGKKAKVA